MLKLDFEEERIKERERIQQQMLKNKNRNTMISFFVVLVILIGIIVYAVIAKMNKPLIIIDNTEVKLVNVNGRLAEYIKGLGNAYYVRYLGEFGETNWNQDIKQATIEYTKEGSKTALYSKELNKHVIMIGEASYSVLHNFRLIVKAKAPVDFDSKEYNLLSDFGQRYVADVKVKEDGVEYVYQEYIYEDAKIRYYFVGDELRYIKIVTGEDERKINVIVDKYVKKNLFELPTDYSQN